MDNNRIQRKTWISPKLARQFNSWQKKHGYATIAEAIRSLIRAAVKTKDK